MTVTMSDIAKDLDVSVVTISKVLRNQGKISAKTRRRVLKRAKELNYQPNFIARSLVTRRTFTVGLLLPDFTHPFFAEIAKSVAETVRPKGYHVIISYFEEDPEIERSEAQSLLARHVDGLIIASAQGDQFQEFDNMRTQKVPFVLIDRPIAGLRASFVGADNQAIGRLATSHLLAQGCTRIAHLRGPDIALAAGRLNGYRAALEAGGLSASPRYIVEAGYHDNTGYEAMRKLLKLSPIPDGVFCYNDPVAIGATKAILEQKLCVPEDISVVGAGNVHYSDLLVVPLTTVDQGTDQIGQRAAKLLLEQMTSKQRLRPQRVLIAPKLVVRQSTRRGLSGQN